MKIEKSKLGGKPLSDKWYTTKNHVLFHYVLHPTMGGNFEIHYSGNWTLVSLETIQSLFHPITILHYNKTCHKLPVFNYKLSCMCIPLCNFHCTCPLCNFHYVISILQFPPCIPLCNLHYVPPPCNFYCAFPLCNIHIAHGQWPNCISITIQHSGFKHELACTQYNESVVTWQHKE